MSLNMLLVRLITEAKLCPMCPAEENCDQAAARESRTRRVQGETRDDIVMERLKEYRRVNLIPTHTEPVFRTKNLRGSEEELNQN